MTKTRFVVISDTHNYKPVLPDGDVLLHCGDFTNNGGRKQTETAFEWLGTQAVRYTSVAIIGGNHDFFLWHLTQQAGVDATAALVHQYGENIMYLEDQLGVIPNADKTEPIFIYGSPVQPVFGDMAWNKKRGEEIRQVWDRIPSRAPNGGVDILMTHGPAHGILDWVGKDRVGCEDLREALARVQPRLHVFGHIHAAYGKGRSFTQGGITTESYNAAMCTEVLYETKTTTDGTKYEVGHYELDPKHKPWVLDFDGEHFVEVA